MPDQINLTICLICHHGNLDDVVKDAELIRRVSCEKRVPITYFFSGIEIDAIANNREHIHNELGYDIVWAIQSDYFFINPRKGKNDPYKSEIGIMPYHHTPLVQPWLQYLWKEYFEIIKDDILWSKVIAEQKFWKTPVTIHPPDGVYAPAAANTLKQIGLDTVVISGEFLSDRHAKGILYWASGLRHLTRTNDIQPQSSEFHNAGNLVERVLSYGHENNMPFVVISCDIDEFNGKRYMNLKDGIARLCCIGDEVYNRNGRIKMVNANAAAYWNLHQTEIEKFWPWNDVHAMIHSNGDLGFIDEERNNAISHVIWLISERYKQGWDVHSAKEHFCRAADIACRNKYFKECLTDYFLGNINYARRLLQGY